MIGIIDVLAGFIIGAVAAAYFSDRYWRPKWTAINRANVRILQNWAAEKAGGWLQHVKKGARA